MICFFERETSISYLWFSSICLGYFLIVNNNIFFDQICLGTNKRDIDHTMKAPITITVEEYLDQYWIVLVALARDVMICVTQCVIILITDTWV